MFMPLSVTVAGVLTSTTASRSCGMAGRPCPYGDARATTYASWPASLTSRAPRLARSSAQRRTVRESRAHAWHRGVGIGAGELCLDVAVELLEALVATNLGSTGAGQTPEQAVA